MKANGVIILMATLLVLGVLVTGGPARAVEDPQGEQFSWGDRSRHGGEQTKAHKIERIMNRLREKDPQRAEELEQLKEQDPQAFRSEIRKIMQKHHGRKSKGRRRFHTDRESGIEYGQAHEPCDIDFELCPKGLEWCKKYCPKMAKMEHHGREPVGPKRRARSRGRRWAAKKHPELAEAMAQSKQLKKQRNELLEKIKAATDDQQKTLLTAQLKDVVGKRFDLILKRKQLRYQMLQKKLEKMQKRLEKSGSQLEQWKEPAFKDTNVNKRVEKLIAKTEQFKWD